LVYLIEAQCVVCEVRTEFYIYCELTLAFHIFSEYFYTTAVCAIDNYESLYLLVATISVKIHMLLVILIYFFQMMYVIYCVKVVHLSIWCV